MEHFLQGVAKYIHTVYNDKTAGLAVVFPGKRSRLFLNKYLSEISEKPMWAPAYFTITELMEKISGLQVTEKLTLIFELFEVYSEITKSNENIDDFYFYCEMILSDFDDADKYLVNTDDLFRNVAELKNLNDYFDYLNTEQVEIIQRFWNTFQHGKHSEEKDRFVSLWDTLASVYREFNKRLRKKKIAYEGMVYRDVAEKILNNEDLQLDFDKILFVGFNALNKAEDIVFNHLKRIGKAEFFWDYDEYYTNNKIHEAGFLLRENLSKYPAPDLNLSFKSLTSKDKKITFVNIPSNSGQTIAVSHFLDEFRNNGIIHEDNTAIILGDENLLPATLSSIPSDFLEVNVSMGYSFKNSSLYDLIFCLSKLSKNSKTDANNKKSYYYKDVLLLLNLSLVNSSSEDKIQELKNSIINSNIIYLPAERLGINSVLEAIVNEPSETKTIPEYLLNVLVKVNENMYENKNEKDDYELEFLYNAIITIKRLGELINNTAITFATQTIYKLLLQSLGSLSVPFIGEPLKGLQVMGILETRGIDFENIIMLSLNEGIFPKSGNIPTFIPLSLRHGFGLPVPEHRDSLYAFYFYRLIQRAKNVVLVYNSHQDGLFSGERSRFLHQLYYESVFNVTETGFATNVSLRTPKKIVVEKDARIMDLLSDYLGQNGKRYFTASAINSFLTCNLKFYFRYMEGLSEPVEVSEELDPAMFGNVLHKAVETIYEPYTNTQVTSSLLDKILSDKTVIRKALDDAFNSEYLKNENIDQLKGRNVIIKEIIYKYLKKIIEVDKEYAPFKMIKHEQKFKSLYAVDDKLSVWVGGRIDRIDEKGGKVRIIDYKTGKKKDTFRTVDELFDVTGPERNIAVFQIFFYSLLYEMKFGKQSVIPGIYFVKDIFNDQFDFHIFEKENCKVVEDSEEYLPHFESRLKETFKNLFDPSVPFTQTEDIKSCGFCPYSSICHRG